MDIEELQIEVSMLYSGNKSFWRTGQTLDIIMFEHKTILNGDNRVIEVICYDPQMDMEFTHIYLNYTMLFGKVQNITTNRGVKVKDGSKYTQSLLSKYIYSRIGFSDHDTDDFGWNYVNKQKQSPEVVLIPYSYDITLDGRLDIEIKKPISGLGILPIIIHQPKVKDGDWLEKVEAFKKDVEATGTLVTLAEKVAAMKTHYCPTIDSDDSILKVVTELSTGQVSSVGIFDQDSDENSILPAVFAPFPAPATDTSLTASLNTEDSSGTIKSSNPHILGKEKIKDPNIPGIKNDIATKVSPLLLSPPHKPVNEKRQSFSARTYSSSRKISSPSISNSAYSSPRVIIRDEKTQSVSERKASMIDMRQPKFTKSIITNLKMERSHNRSATGRANHCDNNEVNLVINSAIADKIKGQENELKPPGQHLQNIPLRSYIPLRSSSIISQPSSPRSQPQPPVRRKTMGSIGGIGSIGKQRNVVEKEIHIENDVTKNDVIEANIVIEGTIINSQNNTDKLLV
jgi:hypothetical protein